MAFFDVAPFDFKPDLPSEVAFDPFAYVTRRSQELFADPKEVRGPRRFRRLVRVRSVISQELRQRGLSLPEIGRHLGGRDHTTIIALLRRGNR